MLFDPEDLRDPAVLIALGGWADAANASCDALRQLVSVYEAQEIGAIDDERYWDYQQTRPQIRESADGPWIEWPSVRLHLVRHPERDLVVMVGPEPSLLWRSFAREVVERIRQFSPSMVVILGAMLSDTPHSRALPVGMYSNNPGLREGTVGVENLDYTGPTGVLGVVAHLLDQVPIPTAQVWVSVPHYVSSPPNPKAQLALTAGIEELLGLTLDRGDLEKDSERWVAAVDELASADPDVAEYIQQLVEVREQEEVEEATGDKIAAEFERYLRRRRDDRGGNHAL